jgi:uncharacterized membrane protein
MRETSKRTLIKALSWQLMGVLVMAAVAYVVTGSLIGAGGFSLALQAFSLVCYILHERVWGRISWGLQASPSSRRPTRAWPLPTTSTCRCGSTPTTWR